MLKVKTKDATVYVPSDVIEYVKELDNPTDEVLTIISLKNGKKVVLSTENAKTIMARYYNLCPSKKPGKADE
jgi:hypothetical protein